MKIMNGKKSSPKVKKLISDGVERNLILSDFQEMCCDECGQPPEKHVFAMRAKCCKSEALTVKFIAERDALDFDCSICGRHIMFVQIFD